jgi:hypothetical protein
MSEPAREEVNDLHGDTRLAIIARRVFLRSVSWVKKVAAKYWPVAVSPDRFC